MKNQSLNQEELNRRFLKRASNAEQRLTVLGRKLKSQPNYGHEFDETLALFYVFNHLHESLFLASRTAFLAHLGKMKLAIPLPTDVLDHVRFERHYVRIIDEIIAEFK